MSTPAELNDRITGWREIREDNSLEAWRQTRAIISYNLQTVEWKNGRSPDMLQLMPLPGDPERVEIDINEDNPDNAFRWWKMEKNLKVKWPEWKQEIIQKHYRPEWEEMRKKKT